MAAENKNIPAIATIMRSRELDLSGPRKIKSPMRTRCVAWAQQRVRIGDFIFRGPERSSSLERIIVAIAGMFLFSAAMNAKLAFPAAVFYLVSIHNRNM